MPKRFIYNSKMCKKSRELLYFGVSVKTEVLEDVFFRTFKFSCVILAVLVIRKFVSVIVVKV